MKSKHKIVLSVFSTFHSYLYWLDDLLALPVESLTMDDGMMGKMKMECTGSLDFRSLICLNTVPNTNSWCKSMISERVTQRINAMPAQR